MSTAVRRRVVTVRTRRASARISTRSVAVCLAVLVLAFACVVVSLALGDFRVPFGDVVRILLGGDGGLERTIVLDWRLPRVLTAVGFGAALGVSGAIFQTLTRNPLGSPDVIGFNTGAYTGALVVLLVAQSGFGVVAFGALVGGLVTALLVYLLAYRGGTHGYRLIVVGIGVSAMLTSFNQWLIARADLDTAISAAIWGAGTLNGIRWGQAGPALVVIAPLLLLAFVCSPRLRMLDLGDDAAAALGVRVERARLVLLVIGVALTAGATAVAGPIAFVALAAPQIARRLVGSAGITLVPAACVGALLLVASDLVAGHLFSPVQLPVGVVTVSVGGIYLVWLLLKEARA